MTDLQRRFASLDRAHAPHQWQEIEARASVLVPQSHANLGGMAIVVLTTAVITTALIAALLLATDRLQPGGAFAPLDAASAEPTPADGRTVDPYDQPDGLGADLPLVDEDRFPIGAWRSDVQLHAGWVGGELCYAWVELFADVEQGGVRYCTTLDRLRQASDWSPLSEIVRSSQAGGELWLAWAVIDVRVASVIVEQDSGVVEPEMVELPPGPDGELIRLIWLRPDPGDLRWTAYDSRGDVLGSGQ